MVAKAKKKTVVKKSPAKSTKTVVRSKKTAKKAVTKKRTVKKTPAKKTAKTAAKKTAKKTVKKTPAKKTAKTAAKSVKKVKITAKAKEILKKRLHELRERLSGQITSLKAASLTRNDSVVSVEDGTDAFERQFALNLASSENDALFEIDEALRRLAGGTYGVCEGCECVIKTPRLSALPFVRMCIKCQSESEKDSGRRPRISF